MGDGGVAFVHLQQQQFIIMKENLSATTSAGAGARAGTGVGEENLVCGGEVAVAAGKSEVVRKKKVVKVRKVRVVKRKKVDKKVENAGKDEVEEGELGTLKLGSDELENGEFLPEKEKEKEVRGNDVQKGAEIDTEKRKKGAAEDRDENEKGEFVPDRRWKGEAGRERDDYGYSRVRRYDSVDDKCWKGDREWTPPSGKYDASRRNEFSRSGNQLGKSLSRWESAGHDRSTGVSSKVVDEDGVYRAEYNNGKDHVKEHSYNRLKRYTVDSDNGDRKHHGDYVDYVSSKSRRLSHESSSHLSRHSAEKSGRHTSSSRVSSSDKYSSRHYDSSFSSRTVYDRRGHSPGRSEWSPHDRARSHDHRDRSPVYRDRSPYARGKSPYSRERFSYDRARYHDHRNRSPSYSERSPYSRRRSPFERSRCSDYKNRSPAHAEQSPQERARYPKDQNSKDERSPPSLTRANGIKEINKRSGATEKSNSQYNNVRKEEKLDHRDVSDRGPSESATGSFDKSSSDDIYRFTEKDADFDSYKEKPLQNQNPDCRESPCVDGPLPEELASMEEDMDICDTPPHDTLVTSSSAGKWYYLDHLGVECGPSKLCELKALVEEGVLMSDHMIKHLDNDRWVTVENATSPLIGVNFSTIASDSITQLASPPEAPGNLLIDNGEAGVCADQKNDIVIASGNHYQDSTEADFEALDGLHIDERVGALLEGFLVTPGKELEILGEALQTTFEQAHWDRFMHSQDLFWNPTQSLVLHDKKADVLLGISDLTSTEVANSCSDMLPERSESRTGWHSSRWSCKGGDWKRNDDVALDKSSRKKLVLNDGFPLCQMPKSECEDPRWQCEDELYHTQSQKLNLPPWAFSSIDEKNDIIRTTQTKMSIVRGVKGTMMPVVRINACVVKDQGLSVSEPRIKARGRERYSSRSVHSSAGTSDSKRSSVEGDSSSRSGSEQIQRGSWKNITSIETPKDRLFAVNELHLPFGDWYYLDGAGHEQGPFSFSELQKLVDQGAISKDGSVFRKSDKVWVPVTSVLEASAGSASSQSHRSIGSFHNLYPQFIGYTRWKLHELVMKSYKSREFAAAINDVLDPWINAKQPKKEVQSHGYHMAYGSETHAVKRARLLIDEDEEDNEIKGNMNSISRAEISFDDLCGVTAFYNKENACSEAHTGSWGLLDGCLLARIFHCLRSDLKSLVFASLTCKHWRTAIWFYKNISKQVDLSSIGSQCSDSTFQNILTGYKKENIDSLILVGCTSITSGVLEDAICTFPLISSINISGCSQFNDLVAKFQNINWFNRRGSVRANIPGQLHSKMKSLKQITDKTSIIPASKGYVDDFGELKEYFDSVDKRDSNSQFFRRSLYKRSKLFDARKSSSISSRDARTRRWTIKKSENGYKRVEELLASSLKEIMKVNTFDFFVSKVAEIEARMKNGYYISHGLNSVKEDISRMCRDALKAKNQGDVKGMNHIITLFIQLASRFEESSKTTYKRDEMMRSWEDDAPAGFASISSNYRKKLNSKRYPVRTNDDYTSDREIKRRLSRLNRKSMDTESGTSEDSDGSKYNNSYSQSTNSDTESDLDLSLEGQIGESRGNGNLLKDEYSDYTDDREWGARMTKASLVPPVTRKYEVIDQYVIVADEEDVQRKMRVSLPEDYAEKLDAQRNGIEESDMELPEVKDFKPRKSLDNEVVEQEVYGIDPYTHNLLLDSMPEDLDWSLLDKHVFIEDLLLRTLNKQVRRFTGTGSTPMMYPLQPVIEEIEKGAVKDHDMRTLRMCKSILKAMESRPDDKYVAYRKGLGVVCNKEGGFGEDDFVVEFLGEVYPAWKWFEKQDGIRSLQKNKDDPAPEFYNIYLERPKGDADGYDLVVVDAMHKANYASRICHSCRPNCEAKVTAVNGHYQIGIYSLRTIQCGEEITFDYNSVTESKEEYEASVCLCGSQVCRGSYLNLTGEGAFQKVLNEWHGVLDRVQLMLEACELNSVAEEDYIELGKAGLGSCLLGGLPDWLIAYSARLVRFINFERTKLPKEILSHNLEEKRKYFSDICIAVEKSDAEVQAEGVYNQRLQNLALTLDKVRYVMRCVFGDPKKAPPPLEKLSPEGVVSFVWTGEGSVVQELLQSMANHLEEDALNDLKSKIHAHDPLRSDNIVKGLRRSLLWLRDEIRNLTCTYKCRHDAAADLLHIYAYTKFFYRIREYKPLTSSPVYISPLDLGPKYADKLGAGLHEYCKQYGENYCLGQLIFWHNQSNAEPDDSLMRASRGCLCLPDISSFYAKKPQRHFVYGPKTVKLILSRMAKQPQRPWPEDRIWSFKSLPKVFGSPMLDAVSSNSTLDREIVNWLKNRAVVFQDMYDQ